MKFKPGQKLRIKKDKLSSTVRVMKADKDYTVRWNGKYVKLSRAEVENNFRKIFFNF